MNSVLFGRDFRVHIMLIARGSDFRVNMVGERVVWRERRKGFLDELGGGAGERG